MKSSINVFKTAVYGTDGLKVDDWGCIVWECMAWKTCFGVIRIGSALLGVGWFEDAQFRGECLSILARRLLSNSRGNVSYIM